MTSDGRDALAKRLEELRSGLRGRGLTDDDICGYFGKLAGRCVTVQACSCRAHETGPVPLPPGRMCARAFRERLQDLMSKMDLVGRKVDHCKAYLEQLAAYESGLGFMHGSEDTVGTVRRRRKEAEAVEAHERGLYCKLLSERAELLLRWEPIDVDEFHAFCSAGIREMCDIAQALKAGDVPAPAKGPSL